MRVQELEKRMDDLISKMQMVNKEVKNKLCKDLFDLIVERCIESSFIEANKKICRNVLEDRKTKINYDLIMNFMFHMKEKYNDIFFAMEKGKSFEVLIDETNKIDEDILYKDLLLMNKIMIFKPFVERNDEIAAMIFLFLMKEHKINLNMTDRELYLVFELFKAADNSDVEAIKKIESLLFV